VPEGKVETENMVGLLGATPHGCGIVVLFQFSNGDTCHEAARMSG
jgi:hypothetical protein